MIKSQRLLEYLIYFVCVLLLHDHYLYLTTPKRYFIANETKFTISNPRERQFPVSHFQISENKLVNLNDFKYLINSDVCKNDSIFILFVVSSDPANYEKRMAIRETWGRKDSEAVRIVFTFGVNKRPKVEKKIKNESLRFQDIVQGNFVDAYRNLTYKHVMGLKWAWAHCRARYIVKSDDDTFIHRQNLYRFLTRELSPWGSKNLIACGVWKYMPVLRQNNSKWYVSKEEFEPEFYPPYCSGMFMIYSRDVCPYLVKAAETTKYLFVDDAFVTGILAEKAKIPRTNIFYLYHNWDQNRKMFKEGLNAVSEFVWGPCNVQPAHMRTMWNFTNTR